MRISSPPTIEPLLLRHRHAAQERADRLLAQRRGDPPLRRGRHASATCRTRGCWRPSATPPGRRHCTACFSGRYPVAVSVPDQCAAAPVREGAGLSGRGGMPRLLAARPRHPRPPPGRRRARRLGHLRRAGRAPARLGGGDPHGAGPDFDPAAELPGVSVFVRALRGDHALRERVRRRTARGGRWSPRAPTTSSSSRCPTPGATPTCCCSARSPASCPASAPPRSTPAASAPSPRATCARSTTTASSARAEWVRPERDLLGVHVLFLSEHDLPDADARARELLSSVPIVALTRGWRGLTLLTRDAVHDVPSLPRPEVDPTGAGDVFAAAFLVRYHETGDPLEAAAFAACAASCAVEGVGRLDPRRPRRGRAPAACCASGCSKTASARRSRQASSGDPPSGSCRWTTRARSMRARCIVPRRRLLRQGVPQSDRLSSCRGRSPSRRSPASRLQPW